MKKLLRWLLIDFNRQPLYKTGQLLCLSDWDLTDTIVAITDRHWSKKRGCWKYQTEEGWLREITITKCIKDYGDLGCL